MTLQERIAALLVERGQITTELRTLLETVEAEARDMTEEESATFDTLETRCQALDKRRDRLERAERAMADRLEAPAHAAAENSGDAGAAAGETPGTHARASIGADPRPTQFLFARVAQALYRAHGVREGAADLAQRGGDDLVSAYLRMPSAVLERAAVLPGSTTDAGGFAPALVQVNQAISQFIELLRGASIVFGLEGLISLDFERAGSITIPGQTGSITGGWIGEGGAIPVQRPTFGPRTMLPHKAAAIVVASNELLASSQPGAQELITNDMISATSATFDAAFMAAGAGAGAAPDGIRNGGGSRAGSAAGPTTLDDIVTDIKAALAASHTANVPERGNIWLMNPTQRDEMAFAADGVGAFPFRAELNAGQLTRYPVLVSTNVPVNTLVLLNARDVVLARGIGPEIALSQEATLHMNDAPNADLNDQVTPPTPVASMFQTDSTAIRITWSADWLARHVAGVQSVTATNY